MLKTGLIKSSLNSVYDVTAVILKPDDMNRFVGVYHR